MVIFLKRYTDPCLSAVTLSGVAKLRIPLANIGASTAGTAMKKDTSFFDRDYVPALQPRKPEGLI